MNELVSGSKQFVEFKFCLSDDWAGLTKVAQFSQNGESYNQYLDSNDSVFLPTEIENGGCTLVLHGIGSRKIATTNCLKFNVSKSKYVNNAAVSTIPEDLYNELIEKINTLISWDSENPAYLAAKVEEIEGVLDGKSPKGHTHYAEEIADFSDAVKEEAMSIIKDGFDFDNISLDITVDDELSPSSKNPVQNKAITNRLLNVTDNTYFYLGDEDNGYISWNNGNYALLKPLEEADKLMLTPYVNDPNNKFSIVLEKDHTRRLQVNNIGSASEPNYVSAFYASNMIDGYSLWAVDKNATPATCNPIKILPTDEIPDDKYLIFVASIDDSYYIITSLANGKRLALNSCLEFEITSIEGYLAEYVYENLYSQITSIKESISLITDRYADVSVEESVSSGAGKKSLLLSGGIEAAGNNSVAIGEGTKATSNNQVVAGAYNTVDNAKRFIVGGGTKDSNRRNLLTVDQSGNLKVAGYVEDP